MLETPLFWKRLIQKRLIQKRLIPKTLQPETPFSGGRLYTSLMKQIAHWALDTAAKRGATYCDVRIVNDRQRALATKNGKIGHAADSESLGIGVRVLVNNAWGFASTDELTRESVEATAGRAVEIARASSRVQQHPIRLAPEKAVTADWTSQYKIDPFSA